MTYTSEETTTLAEEIKHRVQPFLVSRRYYDENLGELMSSDFLDLKICYYVPDGNGKRLLISNKLLKSHEIPADSIKSQALENLKSARCHSIRTMEEVLTRMGAAEMLPKHSLQSPFPIYVLTNTDCYLGAAGILLDSLLADFAETIENSFFVLPSSLHEVLFVPESSGVDTGHLNEIIRTVNTSQVAPQEVLSDHAYYYDRETKQLQM